MPEGITAQKFQTLGPKLLTLNQGSAHEPVSKCFRLCGPYSLAQLLNSAVVAREHHAQWKWMGVAVCQGNAIFSDRQQVGFGPRDLFATSGSKLSSVRSCHQGSLGSGNISIVGLNVQRDRTPSRTLLTEGPYHVRAGICRGSVALCESGEE